VARRLGRGGKRELGRIQLGRRVSANGLEYAELETRAESCRLAARGQCAASAQPRAISCCSSLSSSVSPIRSARRDVRCSPSRASPTISTRSDPSDVCRPLRCASPSPTGADHLRQCRSPRADALHSFRRGLLIPIRFACADAHQSPHLCEIHPFQGTPTPRRALPSSKHFARPGQGLPASRYTTNIVMSC
jgi:hypothetical protein